MKQCKICKLAEALKVSIDDIYDYCANLKININTQQNSVSVEDAGKIVNEIIFDKLE